MSKIVVADDGGTTLTYSDGSQDRFAGTQTVIERPATDRPTISTLEAGSRLVTGKGTPQAIVTVTFPMVILYLQKLVKLVLGLLYHQLF